MAAASAEQLMFQCDAIGAVVLTLYFSGQGALVRIPESEAAEYGEEPLQIIEGSRYEYKLSDERLRLREAHGSGIVEPSSVEGNSHCGAIVPRQYTGRL